MMTLLDVFDCSFSDSLVQRFSAPEIKNYYRNDLNFISLASYV